MAVETYTNPSLPYMQDDATLTSSNVSGHSYNDAIQLSTLQIVKNYDNVDAIMFDVYVNGNLETVEAKDGNILKFCGGRLGITFSGNGTIPNTGSNLTYTFNGVPQDDERPYNQFDCYITLYQYINTGGEAGQTSGGVTFDEIEIKSYVDGVEDNSSQFRAINYTAEQIANTFGIPIPTTKTIKYYISVNNNDYQDVYDELHGESVLLGTTSTTSSITLYDDADFSHAIYEEIQGSQTIEDNYNFLGWSTSGNSRTVTYTAGQTITPTDDLNLYAVLAEKSATTNYTITYHFNDSNTDLLEHMAISLGDTQEDVVSSGSSVTLLDKTTVEKYAGADGITFAGWATSDGGSVVYTSGATITPSSNLDLYAVWQTDSIKLYAYWQDQTGTTDTRDWNNHETANHYIGTLSAGSYKLVFYLKEAATRDGGWNLSDAYDEQIMGAGNFTANGFNQAGWHEYDVTLEDNEADVYLTIKTDAPYFCYLISSNRNIVWCSTLNRMTNRFSRVEYTDNEIDVTYDSDTNIRTKAIPLFIETSLGDFDATTSDDFTATLSKISNTELLIKRNAYGKSILTITSGEAEKELYIISAIDIYPRIKIVDFDEDESTLVEGNSILLKTTENKALLIDTNDESGYIHDHNGFEHCSYNIIEVSNDVLDKVTIRHLIDYAPDAFDDGNDEGMSIAILSRDYAYTFTLTVTPVYNNYEGTPQTFTVIMDTIDSTSSVEEVTAGTFQVGGDVVAATGAGIAGLLTPLQLVSQDYTLIDNGNFTLTLKQPIEVTKTITEHWHYAGDVEQEPIVGTIECLRLGFSDTIFSVSGDIVDGTDVMNELNKSITLTEISNVASSGLISLSVEGEYSDSTAIDKNFTVTILFAEQPSEWYLIRTTTAPTLPTGWAFTSALSIADTDVAQRIKLVARYGDTDEQKDVYIFYVPSTHRIVVSGEGWNGDYDADPIILSLNNSTNLFTLLNLPATAETVNDSPFEVEVTAANYAGTIKLRLHRSIE